MSSSLEQDYEEFKFSTENQLEENVEEKLNNFTANSINQKEVQRCAICEQNFETKKDLQTHVLIHLGKPRVILKRILNPKPIKKELNDNYWLGTEHKGNLKITLKRQQSPTCDSLKLKLKKSPVSESFTVVSNNFNFEKESLKEKDELADTQNNDSKSDAEEEKTTEESFENVMLNQNNYDDENFESESDQNPLESSERPTMDNNEGDSGVGSDFVNPLEREDQNDDDLQADNASNSDQVDLPENEDPEESDALEATCRETIENLKKLGEQSRYISSRSSDILDARQSDAVEDDEEDEQEPDPEPEPEPEPEEEEEEEEEPEPEPEPEDEEDKDDDSSHSNPIRELQRNSEISIVPKSALMPEHTTRRGAETEIVPVGGSGSFSWNKIIEDSERRRSRSRSRDSSNDATEKESSESAGSLLQNFLIEQERSHSNKNSHIQSLETEYVSLERLAETVNTCRVCNEKFKDIAHLDAHRSKAGHYQCNIPDCSSLVFTNPIEVSVHKSQVHGAPTSPSLSNASASPRMNQASPHMNVNSPHSPSIQAQNSPMTSPHTNSPTTFNVQPTVYPPVNMEQLPAPVQQLAQQVQRMPLPQQAQMPGVMGPGGNALLPAASYYPQPPGRPPLYRVQTPMHYPPHLAHLYQQYSGNPYQQMGMQPQLQMPQQMPRGRYPAVMPGQRTRMPQPQVPAPMPRQRLKRSLPPQSQVQQQSPVPQKRRMDVLMPDRNEDADCHIIAQQKRNDGLPVIQNVQGGTTVQTSRSDSTIHLTDSITLSVRQPGPNPAQVNAMVQNQPKKPDASAVANVLAARGITVTPASNKKTQDQQQQQSQQSQPSPSQQQQKQPLNVTALNLNSAISIIPTATQRKQQEQQQQPQQQAQFAVPQNKQAKQVPSDVERPPRPPTVDLTQDALPPPPLVRRGRPPRMLQSLTCQVCDKRFQSQELLTQHMATHRTSNKLHHKCNLCLAQYPTATALASHKKTYHKEVDTTIQQNDNIELALPVVDLKSPTTLTRLSNLGIQSYIPLSQLSAQTGGYFALPIISIDGARNSNTCNLGALGATSILSLGPLKHLSNR